MNNYTIQKNKLLKHIGDDAIIKLLEKAKCFIAGGAITSVFSGKDINDVDVYFRDYKSLELVLQNLFNSDEADGDVSSFAVVYTHHTKKSILFTKGDLNLQLIYFKFFNSAEEIFDTFDFTINMGAYDCSTSEIILKDNFLCDVAQRKLNVNENTHFPIISLLRIDKYKERGYSISRKDFVKLCLAVNKLKLESWEQLSDAIGGMYGYTYNDLFKTTTEFSIDEALTQLNLLESNLDSVASVDGIDYYTLISQIQTNLKICEPTVSLFYKKVARTSDPAIFNSFYKSDFMYPIGKTVNGGDLGIWVYKSIEAAKKHNSYMLHKYIIELELTENSKVIRDCNKIYRITGDVKVVRNV